MKGWGRVKAVVDSYFPEIPEREREVLIQAPKSSAGVALTTAVLLGRDLWRKELLIWRKAFGESAPPLWRRLQQPGANWGVQRWNALAYESRLLRVLAGSLSHAIEMRSEILRHDLGPKSFELAKAGLNSLLARNTDGKEILLPVAASEELAGDLALIQLYDHWFVSLENADRVEADGTSLAYEVSGYSESCAQCRARWDVRPKRPEWLPPFHPGCRCFAQPRYSME